VDALPHPLPEAITKRDKRGFTVPVEIWLRGHLAASFEEYVFSSANKAFWDLEKVRTLWVAYQSGQIGAGTVWNLYSFARWAKDHGESL
jgi:hypothetical protein